MPCPTVCPRLSDARSAVVALVGGDDRDLVGGAAADEAGQLRRRGPGSAGHDSTSSSSSGPSSSPYLTTSAKPQASSRGRQAVERLGVDQHQLRLPDRADVVLALGQVDAGLAADRRVHHRQQGGRQRAPGGRRAGRRPPRSPPGRPPRRRRAPTTASARRRPASAARRARRSTWASDFDALARRDARADHPQARVLQRRARAPGQAGDVAVADQQHAGPAARSAQSGPSSSRIPAPRWTG